jgi:hypothetical protein
MSLIRFLESSGVKVGVENYKNPSEFWSWYRKVLASSLKFQFREKKPPYYYKI